MRSWKDFREILQRPEPLGRMEQQIYSQQIYCAIVHLLHLLGYKYWTKCPCDITGQRRRRISWSFALKPPKPTWLWTTWWSAPGLTDLSCTGNGCPVITWMEFLNPLPNGMSNHVQPNPKSDPQSTFQSNQNPTLSPTWGMACRGVWRVPRDPRPSRDLREPSHRDLNPRRLWSLRLPESRKTEASTKMCLFLWDIRPVLLTGEETFTCGTLQWEVASHFA